MLILLLEHVWSWNIILNFNGFFSEVDIIVGGQLMTPKSASVAISNIYSQDDYTWCVQTAKIFPMLINLFLGMSPGCWLVIVFGVGYVSGLLFYIMIQFDLNYTHRNHRDWHYTTLLIAMPAVIGMNLRYLPKAMLPRLFFLLLMQMCFIYWQLCFYNTVRFQKSPVKRYQVSTIAELSTENFHLAGTNNVLDLISFDRRVCTNAFQPRFHH